LYKARNRLLPTVLLALMLPLAAMGQTLDQAARQAAGQFDAKVLSARTVQQGDQRVHVIKLLTSDGVVKTVRITVRDKKPKKD